MSACEMDRRISTKAGDVRASLLDAEQAIIWLEEAAKDERDVERASALKNVWRQIHGAYTKLDDIHPGQSRHRIPEEYELTEEEKKAGGYWNKDGFYTFPVQKDRGLKSNIDQKAGGNKNSRYYKDAFGHWVPRPEKEPPTSNIEWEDEALAAAWDAFNSCPRDPLDDAAKPYSALARALNAACSVQGISAEGNANKPGLDVETDHYDGGCPVCGGVDGMANVGRTHWYYCLEHKKKWSPGANLYSGWRNQSEEEQRRIYDEIGLSGFEEVVPLFPKEDPNKMKDKATSLDTARAAIDDMLSQDDLAEVAQYALCRLQALMLAASSIPF